MSTDTATSSSVIARHLSGVTELIRDLDHCELAAIAAVIDAATQAGRCVFVCGNGGSAATAEHFVADLTHVTGAKAMCLSSNVSQITATGNDCGYDQIFARELRLWLEPNDVVLALSVSGTSPNCVNALQFAQQSGAITVGLLGAETTGCAEHAHHALHVGSTDHRSVESVHMAITHAITDAIASMHG